MLAMRASEASTPHRIGWHARTNPLDSSGWRVKSSLGKTQLSEIVDREVPRELPDIRRHELSDGQRHASPCSEHLRWSQSGRRYMIRTSLTEGLESTAIGPMPPDKSLGHLMPDHLLDLSPVSPPAKNPAHVSPQRPRGPPQQRPNAAADRYIP